MFPALLRPVLFRRNDTRFIGVSRANNNDYSQIVKLKYVSLATCVCDFHHASRCGVLVSVCEELFSNYFSPLVNRLRTDAIHRVPCGVLRPLLVLVVVSTVICDATGIIGRTCRGARSRTIVEVSDGSAYYACSSRFAALSSRPGLTVR